MKKSNHTIIDCHTHLTSISQFDGFLRYMDTNGVSAVNLLAMVNPVPPWWSKPGTPEWNQRNKIYHPSINFASMLFKALHPDKAYVFGNLSHNTPGVLAGKHDYAQQARTLIDMGVDGFKMWEGAVLRILTGLPLDSPVYDEYYSLLESESLPILYHVNPPYRSEVEGMLAKHPNLKVIIAHFYRCSRDLELLGNFLDTWPNVYVDLAPGMIFRGLSERRDEAREFFIKYQDRILFGTDAMGRMKWNDALVQIIRTFLERKDDLGIPDIIKWGRDGEQPADEMTQHVLNENTPDHGLYLDDGVLKKIYADNFLKIAGKPKKANTKVALSECEKLLEQLREEPADADEQEEQRNAERLREVAQIAAEFKAMT